MTTATEETQTGIEKALPVLAYEQFRKLYKATRNFQRYTSQDRADIAASHRQGHVQRQAVGEFFYTHDLCPGVAFDTAAWATQEAYKVYLQSVESRDELKRRLDSLATTVRDILPILDDTAKGIIYNGPTYAGVANELRTAVDAE